MTKMPKPSTLIAITLIIDLMIVKLVHTRDSYDEITVIAERKMQISRIHPQTGRRARSTSSMTLTLTMRATIRSPVTQTRRRKTLNMPR